MTKEERLLAYRRAYDTINSGLHQFMCHALTQGINVYGRWFEKELPEFSLFNPKPKRPLSGAGSWTKQLNTDTKNFRLTILAFCIAMCEE